MPVRFVGAGFKPAPTSVYGTVSLYTLAAVPL